jgi:hypothetical protein
MRLEINIDKKQVIVIIGVMVLAISAFGVIASHTSGTPNPGHDINEVGGIPTCSSGQVLSHTANGIECVDDVVGTFEGLDQDTCTWTGWTYQASSQICPIGYYVVGVEWSSGNDNEHARFRCCLST